jgi:hypothetical protein
LVEGLEHRLPEVVDDPRTVELRVLQPLYLGEGRRVNHDTPGSVGATTRW